MKSVSELGTSQKRDEKLPRNQHNRGPDKEECLTEDEALLRYEQKYIDSKSYRQLNTGSLITENKQIFPVFTFGPWRTHGRLDSSVCVHGVSILPGNK